MSILKQKNESFTDYISRVKYGVLRRVVPSLREQHRLGEMVGPARYWSELQTFQFNFLKKMGLKPHHTLLDIGCGPLSGGLVFIPYLESEKYVGVDIRPGAIAEAHIQVAKAGLADKNPLLLVSESFGRDEMGCERKFDYIWMTQLFCHLNENVLNNCLKTVADYMTSDSRFYGDILGYPNEVWEKPGLKWQEFTFYLHSLESIESVAEKYGLKVTCLGEIEKYGYPVGVGGLKNNKMLEFRRK